MKIFCIIFIIYFILPSIFSTKSGKLLSKICNKLSCIFQEKYTRYECIWNYIISTQNFQTELFAEKQHSGYYKIMRRIVLNDEIKNLKIRKSELLNYFSDKFENMEVANEKTEKCFSMNKIKFDEKGKYLTMTKLARLIDTNEIVISKEWNTKFYLLQKCMLDFIINSKLYKFGTIETIYLKDLNARRAAAAEDWEELRKIAIIRENKFNNGRNDSNFVLQWKWGANMPKSEETIYEKGDHGFQALKECEQFELDIIKNNWKGKIAAGEKEKIDAMKLVKYFNQQQLFFREIKKTNLHEIECVLEYILETRIVETELYAEYLYPEKYQIIRRIVPNDEMKLMKIHKNEMTKYYYEKLKNKDEANKTEECFSTNKQALLDEEGNILSMKKFLILTENRIILPRKWMDKLDLLQNCLLDFLANSKFLNYENIETILVDKFNDKTREEQEILKAYKLNNGINKSKIVLQWKWGKKGKPKPEETIYEKGDDGFEALKKCEQFELVIKKNNDATFSKYEPSSSIKNLEDNNQQQVIAELNNKIVEKEKEKIDLMKLLKYFKEEQLFLVEIPNGKILFYAENEIFPVKECPICLDEYSENDKLERLYCGHYFHWDCMQVSRKKNNYKCPLCRAVLRREDDKKN